MPDSERFPNSAPSHLQLRFARDGHATRLFVGVQDPPWRVIRAFQSKGGQAFVHLHNVSGGIVSGDSLQLSVEAEPSTRVQITSVGATRVYRQRFGSPSACLFTSIQVRKNALLEYLPDPMIPFSRSRLNQSTIVSLGLDAGLIWWETISSGRTAKGEEFEFDSLASTTSIRTENRLIAVERYCLTPSRRDPRSIARWGRFRYTATMYVCHTGLEQSQWAEVESRWNDLAFSMTNSGERWGVSSLIESGLIIRGLALEAHAVTNGLYFFWERAKRELWNEEAVLPRKIN